MMKKIVIETLIMLFLGVCTGFSTDYYVSPNGNDSNNGLTYSTPFLTPQKAADLVTPGGTVYFLNGVYTNPAATRNTQFAILDIKRSGTAAQHIKFKNYPEHRVKFFVNSSAAISVYGNYSYIDISGFEIQGNSSGYTKENLYSNGALNTAFISANSIELNGRGISISAAYLPDGKPDKNNPPHHITVQNNYIHHTPGSGFAATGADYITFHNNVVHSCAWLTWNGESGISFWGGCKVAGNESTDYKNFITGNISFSNENMIPWQNSEFNPAGKISDGNGIIIDCRNYDLDGYDFEYYGGGRTLIKDNICMNNGGSGIHSLCSRNLDIRDNIAYMNERTVADKCADIYCYSGTSINVVNNIIYRNNNNINIVNSANNGMFIDRNKDVIYDHNIYFNILSADKAGLSDCFTTLPFLPTVSTNGYLAIINLMASPNDVNLAIENTQTAVRNYFVLNPTVLSHKTNFETWKTSALPQYQTYDDILLKINVFEAIYYFDQVNIDLVLATKGIPFLQISALQKQATVAAGNNNSSLAEGYLAQMCSATNISFASEMSKALSFTAAKVQYISTIANSDPGFINLATSLGANASKLSALFSQMKLSYAANNIAKTAQLIVAFYNECDNYPLGY